MTLKPLMLIPTLGLVCLLSACAGPVPKADPSQAWIGLQGESSDDLLAERVDGKRVDDGRYFEVTPGKHNLEVTLIQGANGDDDQPECSGHVVYDQFKAGRQYHLVESGSGTDVGAVLMNDHGKQVAESHLFSCI
ncbi:hypothetical protein CCU68_25740 [Pseudomonas gingeri NCPPB 3146 = LMG 5327]|uniref:Lipoprotein n=2 Tax=Pseudomonas gingeri TaxID=117681 RepID=A0A7Y7XW95_9PSED|nr:MULTISPECIES: hypothetical protein [Pseudomonas]NVZ24814.1 hypothetical protein [Pseudomonas gingeri]NVZ66887.1 hypothetical protein [Pseudomonas gingeri]NVZ73442.1 hypothetical protein [Pseudomonas gingeri]NWA05578.1 hypothetical protein [Pseudomonas gingeri]NWC13156.1 hypothetical protein [Pseudomonas gingeri]